MLRRVMNSFCTVVACSMMTLLSVMPIAAQNPTGTISGRITDSSGLAVPGATVTISSSALQGTRTTTSTENGDFVLPLLPPGDYTVTVEISGFARVERRASVAVGETVRLDTTMRPAGIEEQVVVSGRPAEAFVGTVQGASNYRHDFVRELPTAGTLLSAVNLSPAASNTGPSGNTSISGAMSFENVFLLNGVQITDNVRGTPFTLFIEDAIQETTVITSGVSAEYGRFSGGVVNAVTRSGGNQFSGSFRTTFTNDDWRTTSPFDEPKTDDTVPTFEYTLGGPILRDRLWFFGAGRNFRETTAEQTGFTNLPYESGMKENRFEGKLTYSFANNHRLQGSYTGVRQEQLGNAYPSTTLVMDLRSVYDRTLPQNLYSAHYSAVLKSNFFVEAQFSRRDFTFEGDGAQTTDLIEGTVMRDQRTGARWWSPTFCGVCVPEQRKNQSFVGKGTYFLSNASGAHNMTFGYDYFNDQRKGENHQSGSDYQLWVTQSLIENGEIYPVIAPDNASWIVWYPVLQPTLGNNFRTHSLFFNDSWAHNKHFTFNLGLRYDKNDGVDAAGQSTAKDSGWSPRLGLVWDPAGNGRWSVNASYGRYIAGIANSIADSASPAGTPAVFAYYYLGPLINGPGQPRVSTADAIRQTFDWFNANGGTDRDSWYSELPGVSTQIRDSLGSPYADEVAFGVSRSFARGAVRADVVLRDYGNFYGQRTDTTTGTVANDLGQVFDLALVENTDRISRSYAALNVQASWRMTDRLHAGGSYTFSRLSGNFDGETIGAGPVTTTILSYPEYADPTWNLPEGRLASDQPHRFRGWLSYDLITSPRWGRFGVSLLQQAESGTPYGAIGSVETQPFVADQGYIDPPATVNYYFTARDAFRTEAMVRTDLGFNYSHRLPRLGRSELFVQFHVLNAFNQFQLFDITGGSINTTVLTAFDDAEQFAAFNPFTDTPVEGVHWAKGEQFGEALGADAYTLPRTFRFNFGFRF